MFNALYESDTEDDAPRETKAEKQLQTMSQELKTLFGVKEVQSSGFSEDSNEDELWVQVPFSQSKSHLPSVDEVINERFLPISVSSLTESPVQWYDDDAVFERFCEIYRLICNLPNIPSELSNDDLKTGEDFVTISFVREIPKYILSEVKFFSSYDIGGAIERFDRMMYGDELIEEYPERISTMKEFFFYYVIRSNLRFDARDDYEVLDSVLTNDERPIRLSSLLGITYTNFEINVGRKFPFLSESTKSRYISCSFIMKYLGRKMKLDVDFDEYYSHEKFLKPLNITKMLKDSSGIIFYSYKRIDSNSEKPFKTINYNRIMAILSFLKFSTFSEVFALKP